MLAERLRPALTHWTRLRGLLGTRSLEAGDGLWLAPCNQVHMFGMRYAIDVVFLDDAMRVLRTVAALQPWRISPKVPAATSVLELPAGTLTRVPLEDGARLAIDGHVSHPAGGAHATPSARPRRLPLRMIAWIVGFLAVTAMLVPLAQRVVTWPQPAPGFVCYWSAATLLARGESPYDLERLRKVQLEHGWDKRADGFGFFEFLPNYYPPSLLGALTLLLVPLGFATARITWLVVNAELLVLSAYLVRSLLPRVSGRVVMVLIPAFCLSVMSVLVGQVTALILFSIVAVWKLLDKRWDAAAGCLLAWAMIKPPLTVMLAAAILLWSVTNRRWRVVGGFAAGAAALLVISSVLVPGWPSQLAHAAATTPFVTASFPWLGTTWLLALRALGISGPALWLAYSVVALPFAVTVLRYATTFHRPLVDVIAISLLAVFFVSPTARPYDEPLLLVPLLILIDKRGSDAVAGVLLFLFLLVPYVEFVTTSVPDHVWFFWMPAVATVAWFGSEGPLTRRTLSSRVLARDNALAPS